MSIQFFLIVMLLSGVLFWLINAVKPAAAPLRQIFNIAVVFAAVLMLLYGFGIFGHSGETNLPSIK